MTQAPPKHARTERFAIVHNQNGEKVPLPLGGAALPLPAPLSASTRHISAPFEANYPDRLHPLGGGGRIARLKPGLETHSASAILATSSANPAATAAAALVVTPKPRSPAKSRLSTSKSQQKRQQQQVFVADENQSADRSVSGSRLEAFALFSPSDVVVEVEQMNALEVAAEATPTPQPPASPPPPVAGKQPELNSSSGHESSNVCGPCLRRQRHSDATDSSNSARVAEKEARKRRERESDRLLLELARAKEKETLLAEEAAKQAKRQEATRVSAYNQSAAEAAASTGSWRPEGGPMYIFAARPRTPPRLVREAPFGADLERQIATRRSEQLRRSAEAASLARLEAAQAAQVAAEERARQRAERADRAERYRRALSAQLRQRPAPLPARLPDASEPVFGDAAAAGEDLEDKTRRRRAAEETAREQLAAAEARRREELMRRAELQRREESALRRAKEDLVHDRAWRYQRANRVEQRLRQDWQLATLAKRERDLLELQLRRSDGGGRGGLLPLSDHPDCIGRSCRICQRGLDTDGQSRVWRDTHFVSGSRFIV